MTYGERLVEVLSETDVLSEKQKKLFRRYFRLQSDCDCPQCGEIQEVASVESKFLQGGFKTFALEMLGDALDTNFIAKGKVRACLKCEYIFTTRF